MRKQRRESEAEATDFLLGSGFGAKAVELMNLVGMALIVVVAALAGIATEAMLRRRFYGGLIGAMAAGLLGAWIGGRLFQALVGKAVVGPILGGIAIIPAIAGAVIATLLVNLVIGGGHPTSRE